jgi:hypothetical protein
LASCAAPTTPAPTSTLTFTPEPTATQTPLPTPTITPSPTQVGGGSGRLVFGLDKTQYANAFPDLKGVRNIFVANIDGTDLVPVTNGLKGYNYLESVSPDGTKALITTSPSEVSYERGPTTQLYVIDLTEPESEPVKLGGGINAKLEFSRGSGDTWGIKRSIAKWVDEARIVYIGQGDENYGIYIVNIDGSHPKNIFSNSAGVTPSNILAIDRTRVYWGSPAKDYFGNPAVEVWWSSIDGTDQAKLESNGSQVKGQALAFSPDGKMIAWVKEATRSVDPNYLNISSTSDINNPKQLELLSSGLSLRWSTDGSKVFVYDIISVVWGIDVTSNLYGIYEVLISSNLKVKDFHRQNILDILNPNGGCNMILGDYSLDGRQILASLLDHVSSDGQCIKKEVLLNLETATFSDVLIGFTPDQWLNQVQWIP